MQTYNKNENPQMLNRAILELNGIFNVNKQPPEEKRLETVATREFVHPIMIAEDFKQTMENYRQYVDRYNKKVWAANVLTKRHNKNIDANRKEKPLSREQQLELTGFYASIASFDGWERNKRIKEYNELNGPIAKKDKIQDIKQPTDNVFEAILHHYNMQLYKRRDQRIQLEVHVAGQLPYVELHSGWITQKEVNDVRRLRMCNRTFRRHRERLEEAGILLNYIFQGSKRPVKMRINAEILSITDNHSSKNRVAENQSFTSDGRTKLPHNNVSNRTDLNKFQIKANVHKHSGERSSLPLTSLNFSSIGNTREQGEQKNDAPAEKMTLSGFLREKIEDQEDFAQNIAAHQYDNYTPIRTEILEKEAFSGTLDRDEFKELVLQDFFKTAAKLWKGKSPYVGSWVKAYKSWMNEKWVTYSGLSSNKHVILSKIPELRYRLSAVGRFLKNHEDFNLLFPGDYFDTTRTTAKEGGFEYTHKAWKKHQEYLNSKKMSQKRAKAAAGNRKRRLTERQKVDKHVQGYLRGKFDLQELFTKVEQLGNRELSKNLPEIVRKANVKFQLKTK